MNHGKPRRKEETCTMEILYECCCGINIHKSVAVVCVIVKSKVDLSVVVLQMVGRGKRADGRNEGG
jgi:hypothetical protein